MNKLIKLFVAVTLMMIIPMKSFAQQTVQTKLTEINIHNVETIEERVFILHSIQENDFFSYRLSNEEGKIDIYVTDDYTCQESNANADFEAFLQDVEVGWMAYTNLDKNERGQLFVEWRYQLEDPVFLMINEDFHRQLRDNSTCDGADPFYTDNGLYQFPAGVNAGNLGSSTPPYYCSGFVRPNGQGTSNCLSTTPNPAFYYMRIGTPGNLNIYMYSTPSHDIDFDCWGPFSSMETACSQLSCSNMVDCSYSAAATENCHINNAQTGQYYILLITNYSNQTCNISFSNIGTGTTDCGILPPLVDNSGPYCVGETIQLTANGQSGASYSWTGPGGFTSNQQNPTRPNCTMNMAGTYTCTIAVGSATNSATTEVVVYPMPTANFDFTTVCVGSATQFTSTSTTNPPGQQITSYQWNFGDGQTGSGASVSHTYANTGTYQVTLTVSTGGHCTHEITKTVTVFGHPTSNFTYTTVCKGNPTQFTSTATPPPGQQITSYLWNFGDGQTGSGQSVSHTYAEANNYTVTHTVSIGNAECNGTNTQTVPVYATPVPTATAQPPVVIYGGVATLTANAGTTGQFNFHWEPADKVLNPDSQTTQTVTLTSTTTFTCTVTNPQGGCTGSTQVTVSIEGSDMTAMATADVYELCEGESTTLHVSPTGGTGNYTYSWSPANTLNNANVQHPIATPPVGTTTYTCHVSDGLSSQDVTVTIRVYPNVEADIYQTICENTTFNFFGDELQSPGVYDHTIESTHGCDSTIHLHLDNWPIYETSVSDHFCQGTTYSFFGEQLNSTGIYYHTLESAHGCDSVIRLSLTQDPIYEVFLTESTCEGGPGYYYNGDYLQPNPTAYIYFYETSMGCDSIVYLTIEEAEYNSRSYYVSICAEEYTWPSNGRTYYQTGIYYDTLTYTGSCDSTIMLNLELRPSYQLEDVVTSCDTYRWKKDEYNVDLTFEQSTVYTHQYVNTYGCNSEVTLILTINDHDEYEFTVDESESCDEYLWDPKGHTITFTDHEDPVYNLSGTYHRTYKNQADCDSLVTMTVDFEYTPHPTPIYPMDATNEAPHWVITATEFQINSYDFNLWDTNPNCKWDTVLWSCEEAPNWVLEPFGPKSKCCRVYVLNHVDDTIWLKAHAKNRCTDAVGIEQKYWLLASFYGIEENGTPTCPGTFDVVPNPNNGQMTLNFEYLSGKVDVRVYDMKGTLIDRFETYNSVGPCVRTYNMKTKSEGIYLFVATGREGTLTKKVVIHK